MSTTVTTEENSKPELIHIINGAARIKAFEIAVSLGDSESYERSNFEHILDLSEKIYKYITGLDQYEQEYNIQYKAEWA